jgi:hypothetical protein
VTLLTSAYCVEEARRNLAADRPAALADLGTLVTGSNDNESTRFGIIPSSRFAASDSGGPAAVHLMQGRQ